MQYQPLLLAGSGTITFQTNGRIGGTSSPKFGSSECYIEARSTSTKVEIGQNTWINNGFSEISECGSISIGQDCHFGHDVFIIESDFHLLDPDKRNIDPGSQPVYIRNNVFIGSRVKYSKKRSKVTVALSPTALWFLAHFQLARLSLEILQN